MKTNQSRIVGRPNSRESGLSLVEFMVAIAIGMIMMVALTLVLVSSMQSRSELEKNGRQLENGRFGIESLKEDIQLAGFFGEYFPPATTTWSTPDPCTTVMQDMGFAAPNYRWNTTANTLIPVGIQGYTESDGTPTCISNRKAGTDIVVIRRLSTVAIKIDANADGTADANVDTNDDGTSDTAFNDLGKGYLMQQSDCSDAPLETPFIFDHETARFTLHGVKPVVVSGASSCQNGGLNTVRQYVQRIFYIGTCNNCSGAGDGIPTLKMVEVVPGSSICASNTTSSCGSTVTRSVAEGIENMQLEYGIDTNGDGAPDSFSAAPSSTDWRNVVAVKIFLLARNTESSSDYIDSKTYSLNSAGTALTGTPFGDKYRRHVYTETVRAVNTSGRRQQ
jgi:type IV pilus assembly protein PilW